MAARLKSLGTGCDPFAAWRWKTLASVTSDLLRMRDAICAATSTVHSALELGARDGGQASELLQSVSDPNFWERVSGLAQIIAPLANFSEWIRGCDCHETQRQQGKRVFCEWQGCRAKSLASRVTSAMADLQRVRQSVAGAHDSASAVSNMMGSLEMKMAWVFEEPCIVWQVEKHVAHLKRDCLASR